MNPLQALDEMKRVTRPGGHVLILAEPDYTHRIDFPDELEYLGKFRLNRLFPRELIRELVHLSPDY